MPITFAEAALVDNQNLTNVWLNDLVAGVRTAFDHGMTQADFVWPLVLRGPIDLGNNRLKGLTKLNNIRFADEFSSVQAAIDDVFVPANATGGIVLLGPKTYQIGTQLDMQSGNATNQRCTIIGVPGSVLQAQATVANSLIKMSKDTATNSTRMNLINITIDMSLAGSTIDCIDTSNTTDSAIVGIKIIGNKRRALVLNRAGNCRILYNEIGRPGVVENNGEVGIYRDANASNVRLVIRGNIIYRTTVSGMLFPAPPDDFVIADNFIVQSAANANGIEVTGTANSISNLIIRNNQIEVDGFGSGTGSGLKLTFGQGFDRALITGNLIQGFDQDSLEATIASTFNGRGLVISGNIFRNPGRHTINIGGSGTLKRTSIHGNCLADYNRNNLSGTGVNVNGPVSPNHPRYFTIFGNSFAYNVETHPNRPTSAVITDNDTDRVTVVGNIAKGHSSVDPATVWNLQGTNVVQLHNLIDSDTG